MCNFNFEARNQVLNKRIEKKKNGIWANQLHNHFLSDTRTELLMFTLRTSYICRDFFTYCSLQVQFTGTVYYDLYYKTPQFLLIAEGCF